MKAQVPMTLIVCGTILLALPFFYGMVHMRICTQTMATLKSAQVNMNGFLPYDYAWYSLFAGLVMVTAGGIMGFCKTDCTRAQN